MLRVVFLTVVTIAVWWSLREQVDQIAIAITAVPPWRLCLSTSLVMLGLGFTGLLWRHVLATHGAEIPLRAALSIFFVGQLGKYVPGSVWSFGVQAVLAKAFGVAMRTTVSASLVFLALHVATGLVVGGFAAPWLDLEADIGPLVQFGGAAFCLVVGVLGLTPGLVRWVARRTGGAEVAWVLRDTAGAVALMAGAWCCYVAALMPLTAKATTGLVLPLSAAFALAYVAGVLVPVAPAGLGAREVIFLVVMTPVVGVVDAAALAVLARVVHTVGDVLVAGAAWVMRHADQR